MQVVVYINGSNNSVKVVEAMKDLWVSSDYRWTWQYYVTAKISAAQTMNTKEPDSDLCGSPDVTDSVADNWAWQTSTTWKGKLSKSLESLQLSV